MTPDHRFRTTRWSVILAASRARTDPASREALEKLCRDYWYPVYAFVRRGARSADDALDLTQGYFSVLLEKDLVGAADRKRGRFRSFLLATVKQYLSDERKRVGAQKRGGAVSFVNLEAATVEERRRAATDDGDSPERAFERQWALTVYQRARSRLEREFVDGGKREQFRLLEVHLSGGHRMRPHAEIAAELGVTEAAIKMAVRRLRKRFGQLLRDEIAQTIADEADLDAEVRHLLEVL